MPTARRRTASAVLALALGLLAACSGDAEPAPEASATPTPTPVNDPAKLTLGVWGSGAELAAYDQVVKTYNAGTDAADVTLKAWPSDAAMTAALAAGEPMPDVLLVSRGDMAQLQADNRLAPVDGYLDARNVDLGDEYSRDALEAFSSDNRMLCMPYGASPEVVYYNTDLVDFPRMEATGIDVPGSSNKAWTLDDFVTAATFATANKPGVTGFAITPTLRGLAPFLLAAGGKLADDETEPTRLAFSDDDTRAALDTLLPPLRDPKISLNPDQLGKRDPVQMFKRGKLAMMVGDRSLVPVLRAVPDLRWDVMPIPTIDTTATVGDYTGLCVSRESLRRESAADLLVALVSEELMKPVSATGYLVPVNQRVAMSEDYLQPQQQPLHAGVFVSSIRHMQVLPFTHQWQALETAAAAPLRQLFAPASTVDIDGITEQVDEAADAVFAPAE